MAAHLAAGQASEGVADTPSRQIVAAANERLSVVDGNGRSIEFRRPNALDRLRLFKAVGPVLAENDRYLGLALLAACVTAIDGVPVPAPATENQVEALVQRLDDTGLTAVGNALEPPTERDAAGDGGLADATPGKGDTATC